MNPDPIPPRPPLYCEPLRPQFHFTARYWDEYHLNPQAHQEGWINDVNGLVYLIGEIERLHGQTFALQDQFLQPSADPLAQLEGELWDVEAEIDLARSSCASFTLGLRGTLLTYTPAERQLTLSCGSQVQVEARAGLLRLRILIDRMSVEVFANRGERSLTHCVQAQGASPALSLRTAGGPLFLRSLAVRKLDSIWTGEAGRG